MISQLIRKIILCAVTFGFVIPTVASAQSGIFSGDLSATAAVKSDYRHRGVSKTNNDFAVQGSLDWFSDSGVYTGIWASNVSDFKGSDVESNIYLGYTTEVDGFIYDIGATAYIYPGGDNANYFETYGSVGLDFGLLTSSVGIAYIFSNDNIGDDNLYFYNDTRATIPNTPFSVDLHLGYEDGAFGNNKLDWKIGTSVTFDQFELGVAYIDTNKAGRRSGSGVMFSAEVFF
ncbi:MAG: hypothetical protein HOH19_05780 [Kordiimonadaceae bacterium]|jgi:uncharacterized protein (TIGR02001 family)|nr:hypothetical protein [Kordiimonadaceae bacterium]MBT6032066.1 hypothetical protein [Kordiimonadaceae bacterium]